MQKINYKIIRSPLCSVGIVWIGKEKNTNIVRIYLSKNRDDLRKRIKRVFPGAKQRQNKKVSFISIIIKRYLEGEIIHFNLSHLQKSPCSKFQWAVSLAARHIPYGRVSTYKGLAKLISSRSARTAGNALAKNPFPIIIPCHRVVGFDRKIGGFQSGQNLKKDLLRLEGVRFDRKGRIPERFFI